VLAYRKVGSGDVSILHLAGEIVWPCPSRRFKVGDAVT